MMGRARWKYAGIEVPHLKVRRLRTKTLYYHAVTGKRLSDDLAEAIKQCEALNAQDRPEPARDTIEFHLETFRTEYCKVPHVSAKTAYEYGRSIGRLTAIYGRCRFSDIEPHHLQKHYDAASKKTRARNDLACFSSFWTWARGKGMHKLPNPREGLLFKRPRNEDGSKPEGRYVTDAEFRAVWEHGDSVVQDAMDLLYLTGADVNVMLRWKRTDIDEDQCLPTRRSKTGKGNRKELLNKDGTPTELKSIIERCLNRSRAATGPYIVQTATGQRVTYQMLKDRFTSARRAAGVWFELRQIRAKTATDAESAERAAELLNNDPRTARTIYRRGPKVRPLR